MAKAKFALFLPHLLLICLFPALVSASNLKDLDVKKGVYLIVHTADMSVEQNATDKSRYILTLNQPNISFFYDRPWKQEGKATPDELLVAWKKNFAIYGKDANPNGTWIIDPQNNIRLLNIIIYDMSVQSQQIKFTIKEFKKGNLDQYLNKNMKDSVLIFTLP